MAFEALQADGRGAQGSAGGRVADSLFAIAAQRFHARIDSLGASLWVSAEFQKLLSDRDNLHDSLGMAWAARGVRMASNEGSYYPAVNEAALVEPFASSLSDQGKQYVAARVADESVPLSDDAALLIPWNDLARRVARWEVLSDSLKDSFFEREATQWHAIYRGILFTGLDNARVFDLETGLVRPTVRAAYQFTRDSLRSYQIAIDARDFLVLLERQGWRETAAVKAFIVDRRVQSMRATQPPSR